MDFSVGPKANITTRLSKERGNMQEEAIYSFYENKI